MARAYRGEREEGDERHLKPYMQLPDAATDVERQVMGMESIVGPMGFTVLQGDCVDVLKTLPDGCVQCVATSPPY